MADLNPSSPQKPKELSMETRLILAFTLMGLVLVAAQYLMPTARPQLKPAAKPEQSQAQPPAAVEAQAQPHSVVPAGSGKAAKASAKAAPALPVVQSQQRETKVIETDVYRVEFSNEGATVRSWKLTHKRDKDYR